MFFYSNVDTFYDSFCHFQLASNNLEFRKVHIRRSIVTYA